MKLLIFISIISLFIIQCKSDGEKLVPVSLMEFKINNGIITTYSPEITFTLVAENAEYMMISSGTSFSNDQWIPFASTVKYTLPHPGAYIFHAKIKSGDLESYVLSAAITYIGENRIFWTYNFFNGNYEQKNMTYVGSGDHSIFYFEELYLSSLNYSHLQFQIDMFDKYSYNAVINSFGQAPDVDDNSKIIVCIYDIKNSFILDENIGGYFNPMDLYSDSDTLTQFNARSNEADILYLDYYCVGLMHSVAVTVAPHELEHMINFYQNNFNEKSGSMDAYIDEGLATIAENIVPEFSDEQKSRASYFSTYSTDSRDLIKNGMPLVYWLQEPENYCLSHVFMTYLYTQSNYNLQIFKDIITDSNSDSRSILNVSRNYNIINAGDDWRILLSNWLTANYLNRASGKFGYNNFMSFAFVGYALTNSSTDLYPGGAVYRSLSTPFSPTGNGSDIILFQIDPVNTAVNFSFPVSSGVLVAFNNSYDITTSNTQSTGILPSYFRGYVPNSVNHTDTALSNSIYSEYKFPNVIPDGNLLDKYRGYFK